MKKVVPIDAILISDNAKKVFRGVIYDVYQWPQKLFDSSTTTFEMLKRPDTVQTLVVKGDQILLVEDTQPNAAPRVHPPGGRVDDNELCLVAAQRELREETGIVCNTWKLIDVRQPQVKIEWFGYLYVATDISEMLEPRPDQGGERIKMQWREYESVRKDVLDGTIPSMQYLLPFFSQVKSIGQLLNSTQYSGKEVDR